jgi:hypothetical protein
MTKETSMAADRKTALFGDLVVLLVVAIGGAIGVAAIIFPVNEHPDIVECDIVTGELLGASALLLLLAIALMLFRARARRLDFQWSAFVLATALLLGLTTKIPEWRREAARAVTCP